MSGEADPAELPEGAELLTYAEAGERLGVDAASVKRRAIRDGWRRLPGNDRLTRVVVPPALLADGAARQAERPGLDKLAAELERQAADAREQRALADKLMLYLIEARAELERLHQAAAAPVLFPRQPLPPGYAVERHRLDGWHRWRRLADGAGGPPVADRWSAWRGAWQAHRLELRQHRAPAAPR